MTRLESCVRRLRICEILKVYPSQMSPSEIAQALGMKAGSVRAVIRKMNPNYLLAEDVVMGTQVVYCYCDKRDKERTLAYAREQVQVAGMAQQQGDAI
ncbi:MAG: hypothetical protein WCR70_03795 [Sphaerochaetaceae bacterium]